MNSDNYQLLINILRKAIIENGRGFDAKDDRMANNPNQMNIMSMYSDIDLDANEMELEFKSSLHDLMWFVNTYRGLTNQERPSKKWTSYLIVTYLSMKAVRVITVKLRGYHIQ